MKLPKDVVLYFSPLSIGQDEGARCGKCLMFIEGGRCQSVAGAIDPVHGVCGLYVHGVPRSSDHISGRLPKSVASYTEKGPTHCGSCRYYGGGKEAQGPCGKVEGQVAFKGCCNYWEPK